TWGYDAFDNIQDGIDGVRASTVHVAAGNYTGFTFAGRDGLEILGAPGAVVNSGCTAFPNIMAWVDSSTNIRIDGLEFDGSSLIGNPHYGICFANDSTGDISNVYVHDLEALSNSPGVWIETDATTVNISGALISHCDIGIDADSGRVNIDDCQISSCTHNAGYGVLVESGADVEISGCCMIRYNKYGIRVNGGTLKANGNWISNNTSYGLYNASSSIVDAKNNYWGAVNGPSYCGNPFSTSGDNVYDGGVNVDVVPWLDASCPGGNSVAPNADFVGTPTSGLPGLEVAFTDLSAGTLGCDILTRAWTFGDGGTADVQDPTHTYNKPGRYTVSVTITDELGLSDKETKAKYIAVLELEEEEAAPAEPAKMVVCYL
ncbi:MAG: right-handed parallel beta-helix repeat-containing protein, partial [Dehalococcoidia bacterium]|nr:right-handed parallel beta-helix repeat-containing protein [Dehalococcoidia bacterium]